MVIVSLNKFKDKVNKHILMATAQFIKKSNRFNPLLTLKRQSHKMVKRTQTVCWIGD